MGQASSRSPSGRLADWLAGRLALATVAGLVAVGIAFLFVVRTLGSVADERARLASAEAGAEAARAAQTAADGAKSEAAASLDLRKATLAALKAPLLESAPSTGSETPTSTSFDAAHRLLSLATRCLIDADRRTRSQGAAERAQFEALLVRVADLVSFQQRRARANALPDLDLLVGRLLAEAGRTQRALTHLSRSIESPSDVVGPHEQLEAAAALVLAAMAANDAPLATKGIVIARRARDALEQSNAGRSADSDLDHPTLFSLRSAEDRRLLVLELETEGMRHARNSRSALELFHSRLAAAAGVPDQPARLRSAQLAFAAFVGRSTGLESELDRAEAAARSARERDATDPTTPALLSMESSLRLAGLLSQRGRRDEADSLHAELGAIVSTLPTNGRWALGPLGRDLVDYLLLRREWDAAERTLRTAWQACASGEFAEDLAPAERMAIASQYVAMYEARGQQKDAETWRATIATLQTAQSSSDSHPISGGVR